MTLRKVPASLALGLLASLAAHAALYGGAHTVGGVYHAVLSQIAQVMVIGFVTLLGAVAWTQSGFSTEGSVLGARLRELLPNLASVIASSAAWYVAVEAIEPQHAGVSAVALLAALVAAAYAALRVAHVVSDAFAQAAIAISRRPFSPRAPAWQRRPHERPTTRRSRFAHRLFARPPPVTFALARA